MDKNAKLDYQRNLETYLEEKKVYNLFEDLMKSLLISQPADPLSFLMQKLESPESFFLLKSFLSFLKQIRKFSLLGQKDQILKKLL